MKKNLIIFLVLAITIQANVLAQSRSWAVEMGNTVMNIWKDSLLVEVGKPVKWNHDQALVLKGLEGLWYNTGDVKYFYYIQKSMDHFVSEDGSIRTYKADNYDIDNILPGRVLLMLYNTTGREKYYKAALALREQLKTHPRTNAGTFLHNKKLQNQTWLDGFYMSQPFYAEWAKLFQEDNAFNDIAQQFLAMEKFTRDAKTGLLYQGYNETKTERWADKKTGRSPTVWARSMGWFGMALVDALQYFPARHPKKDSVIGILNRLANAIAKYQDKQTGLWWNVVDMPGKEKNYAEASASCMFIYTLAKGVRKGYLPESYLQVAQKAYDGVTKQFIKTQNGQLNLEGTIRTAGLGGEPYRDGSFNYYTSEKPIVNSPKGIGAFLLASNEIELLSTIKTGKGKKILLDYYFNHEVKKNVVGNTVQHHYVWDQMDFGGYSLFGHVFNKYGIQTQSLPEAPSANNLKQADVYLIVDADHTRDNPTPNYILPEHINAIYNWVNNGGVLLLFGNDSINTEFTHFNQLAEKFGIHFNEDNKNRVINNDYPMGAVDVPAQHPVFSRAKKLFIKELSTQKVVAPAKPVLTWKGDVLISVAKVGKGTVFAVGDPWFYNEYLDGRKLPVEYENYKAAEDLVQWIIKQIPKK